MEKTVQLAGRVEIIGFVTAFVVAAQEAEYVVSGNTVSPFHLGDMNLQTPANIIEVAHNEVAVQKHCVF